MRITTVLFSLAVLAFPASAAIVVDHEGVAEFDQIPESYFDEIRDTCSFFYGHTSHGSQIMTGLDMLVAEDALLYARPDFHEYGDDLGHNGDTSWVQPTRDWLDAHPECNVVMWSWCGGCSDNTEAGIDAYLSALTQLELDYPGILFIYMTGHLDGSGPGGNLYRSNNQIRDYCVANDKVLFDFADIESWDPDGNYYPDETDACNWCYDWCASHVCPDCGSCAHSHCFNCYLKGKGFWWMMARVSGWTSSGIEDQAAVAPFSLEGNYPNPFNPGTDVILTVSRPGVGYLAVFDLLGKRVATLEEGHFEKGTRSYHWNGADEEGRQLGSGIYFCALRVEGFEQTLKMVMVK
jgi:hypothetical protein